MTDPAEEGEGAGPVEEPRPYRPITTWFFLLLLAVVGLVVIANVLREKYA